MTNIISQITGLYNKGLEFIPVSLRIPLAIVILIFLVFSLINFLKKNLIWLVVFILLLPAAYPSIRQIVLPLVELVKKAPK